MPFASPEQRKAYQREWMRKRREQWISENGPCKRCGSKENLEVDHIDRSTKIDHKVWSWSLERRTKELSKCQVLCHDCHTEKGVECGDQQPPSPHGSLNRYLVHGCRCELCRRRKAEYRASRVHLGYRSC